MTGTARVYHLQLAGVSMTFKRKEREEDLEEEVGNERVACNDATAAQQHICHTLGAGDAKRQDQTTDTYLCQRQNIYLQTEIEQEGK